MGEIPYRFLMKGGTVGRRGSILMIFLIRKARTFYQKNAESGGFDLARWSTNKLLNNMVYIKCEQNLMNPEGYLIFKSQKEIFYGGKTT